MTRYFIALAFSLFLLAFPQQSRAACDVNMGYTYYPNYIKIEGICATVQEAMQACVDVVVAHNYSAASCSTGSAIIDGIPTRWVQAGAQWFDEDANRQPSYPMREAKFFYPYSDQPLLVAKPSKNAGCADICFGDPVNASTGNKFETRREYQGPGEFPLELSWTYNSYDIQNSLPDTAQTFGRNRTHSYSSRIAYFSDASVTMAYLLRPDGKSLRYIKSGANWIGDADNKGRLFSTVGASGAITGWEFIDVRDVHELFDASGKLVARFDKSGRQHVIGYDAQSRISSVTDASNRALVFEYASTNQVARVRLPDGQQLQFFYSSTKDLMRVTYPGSTSFQYLYNEAGLSNAYTPAGSLTGEIDELNQRYSSTHYAGNDKRATSTSLAGGVDMHSATYVAGTSNSYAAESTVTLPTGSTSKTAFTVIHGVVRPTATTISCSGCTPKTKTFTYDSNGNVDIETDFANNTTDTDYNARGLLTQKIEAANESPTAPVKAKRTTQTDWHTAFNVPTESRVLNASNVLEAKTKYAYNARGQATAACQIDPTNATAMSYVCGSAVNAPAGVRQSSTTYCEQADVTAGTCPLVGLVMSSNGPRTDVTDVSTIAYYQNDHGACGTSPTTCAYRKGDLWKVTNALNQTSEILSYDGAGRALSMKDANGVISDMEYNARGWLLASKARGTDNASETDDVITRMDHDATGQVTKVTQADGEFINFGYDAAHRLESISDALGNSITYTLDNAGNREMETTRDPSSALTRHLSRVYDMLGRVQASKNAAGDTLASLAYDANDNLDTSTDGLSRITDQDVDPLNRLIKTIQDKGTGKINATTQFTYDARDNLTKVIDPKNLNTVYTYNGLNDLTQLTSPDTGTTIYTYDAAGNRKTQKDAKLAVTTYSYDVLNRLTQSSVGTLTSTFAYDTVNGICNAATEGFAKGRLTGFTDPSGNTQYCYDRFGNMTRKQITNNFLVSTFAFTYTKAGKIKSITYPSGMVVNYSYNELGQTSQVTVTQGGITTTLVDNLAYLPFGPLKQLSFPVPAGGTAINALTQTRNYDTDYAVQNIGGLNYSVDMLGNIKAITDAAGGNAFEYDNLDRLSKVKDSLSQTDKTAFTYDATGNRLSKKVGTATAQAYSYATTNHRLSSVAGVARTMDANGNTTKTATTKWFTYDARNRMVDFRTGSASSKIVSQYQYNAKGERVRKYKGTLDQARYQYGEGGQLMVQNRIVGGVNTAQEIIWLGDMPIGVSQNGTLHGILTDHLHSPRGVFELATQKTVWRWNMADDAFGENIALDDPDLNGVLFKFDMRFPGQLYDVESGLHYNYFRDYDAITGRYVESDPIGLDGGINSYGYAGQSPIVEMDPFGLAYRSKEDPRPPSFFSLTTVEAHRRGNTRDDSIERGELFRKITAPSIIIAASPNALALAGTTCPVALEAAPVAIPIAIRACRTPLFAVLFGASICGHMSGNTGSARSYTTHRDLIAQIRILAQRLRRSTGSGPPKDP